MKKRRPSYLMLVLAAGFIALSGCTSRYVLVETDPAQVEACDYLGTFAETSNPGREDGGVIKHYFDTTGVKRRVMQRAVEAGATHLVWLHTYSVAAAAQAFRCPQAEPLATAAVSPDGIWEEDLN